MGNYTTNLGLYNTDMTTDGNDTFDFKRDLNDNNDILDSAIGKLSTLTTTDKSSLVNAIIEIVSSLGGKASKDLDNLSATGQAILDGKVEVEALLQQNGYAKFSWKENNVISNLIVCWGNFETTSNPSTSRQVFVNLPISYTNDYIILMTVYIGDNNYYGHKDDFSCSTCRMDTKTLSGFEVFDYYHKYWFTIGN